MVIVYHNYAIRVNVLIRTVNQHSGKLNIYTIYNIPYLFLLKLQAIIIPTIRLLKGAREK